jgi:hypothetical protein
VYESGFDGDGGDFVVEVEGDEDEEDLGRGYPGNLIVKSNNDKTGLEAGDPVYFLSLFKLTMVGWGGGSERRAQGSLEDRYGGAFVFA